MIKQQKIKAMTFVGMNTSKAISLEVILQAACKLTGATREEAVSNSRVKHYVYARQLYCYVAYIANQRIGTERQAYRKSLKEIGALINCDHSTVLASKNKIEHQLGIYQDVTKDIEIIKTCVMIPDSEFNTQLIDAQTVGYYNSEERKSDLISKLVIK
jgi:chromosomal replication initiation ATPase DnaA